MSATAKAALESLGCTNGGITSTVIFVLNFKVHLLQKCLTQGIEDKASVIQSEKVWYLWQHPGDWSWSFQSMNPHVYNPPPPPPKGMWILSISTLSKSKVALYEMMHTAVCLVSILCHNFFGGSIELRHVVISGKVQYKLFFICLSSFEHFCLQILLCTVVLRHKVLALSVETLCLVHAILPENFWIYFTFSLKSIWSF